MLALSFTMSSCVTEVTISDADIQRIVNEAVEAAMSQYPSSAEIANSAATAAATAAAAAVAAGLEGQDAQIAAAVAAAEAAAEAVAALQNRTLEVGSVGGITKLTGETSWTADNIYVIGGKIVVTDGATLNIAPGTLIKARPGTGNDATVIVVARGGTINAIGSASAPIIMTDLNDQITRTQIANGDFVSPNRLATDRGRWGGLVILGKASISDAASEAAVEGIIAAGSENWNLFGGTQDNDNSGTLSYVSIRHTGTQVSPDSELQGLTLGGVGAGTTIHHIESYASNDDGLEIFGGSVNLSHIAIYAHGDDGLDTDYGWNGTIDNVVIELAADSDTAFEYDGPRNPNDDAGNQNTTQNITVFARYNGMGSNQAGQFKENVYSKIINVLFHADEANLEEAGKMESFLNNNANYKSFTVARTFGTDPAGSANLIFSDWYFNGGFTQTEIVGDNTALSNSTMDINTTFADWATIGTSPSSNQGADLSEFAQWTVWSAQANQ